MRSLAKLGKLKERKRENMYLNQRQQGAREDKSVIHSNSQRLG